MLFVCVCVFICAYHIGVWRRSQLSPPRCPPTRQVAVLWKTTHHPKPPGIHAMHLFWHPNIRPPLAANVVCRDLAGPCMGTSRTGL